MTRDEVNAMTDEQLRIKAYELVHNGCAVTAFEMRERGPSVKVRGNATAWFECPDYPNDIAVAWDLFDTVRNSCDAFDFFTALDDEIAGPGSWSVYERLTPRAITKAFIMTMSDNDE